MITAADMSPMRLAVPVPRVRHHKPRVTAESGVIYGGLPVEALREAGCRVYLEWAKVTPAGKALGIKSWSWQYGPCPAGFDDAKFFAHYNASQGHSTPHATHGIGTAVTMTMYRGGHASTVHRVPAIVS